MLPGTGPAFLRVARASRLHSHLLVDQVDTVDTVDVVDGAARATSLWSAPRTQPASTKSSVFSERSRKCRIGIDADQARGSGAPKSKPVRNKRERDLRRAHIEPRQGRKKIAHHFSGGNPRLPQTTSPVGTADNSTAEFQNACRGRVPRWRGWFGGSRTGVDSSPTILGEGCRACSTPFGVGSLWCARSPGCAQGDSHWTPFRSPQRPVCIGRGRAHGLVVRCPPDNATGMPFSGDSGMLTAMLRQCGRVRRGPAARPGGAASNARGDP